MTALLCPGNFYDTSIYPDHVVDGQDETSGFEGFRVGSGRRNLLSYYTPQTANAQRYVEVACDRSRLASFFALDRGHNLDGETVRLWASHEAAFTTYQEVFSITVPTAVQYANPLSPGHPVRTGEGAVLVTFDPVAAPYWRVVVDAMGAGEKPRIGGLWLDHRFEPDVVPPLPTDEDGVFSDFAEIQRGRPDTEHRSGRETSFRLVLDKEVEYAEARWHLSLIWGLGKPTWWVADTDLGDQAWIGYAGPGSYGIPFSGDREGRDTVVSLIEYQPELR